ncbi:MAG: ABC transporter ATP-binding protein [Candidatus Heimdallarchaeota archaeon]|nr:ABC transporter ATP-binding protein [Candidatus Heimdallarchaeota archaeon]
MDTGIDIVNLSKEFGEVKALQSINVSIPRGKIVGLLGPNGAGKSTLVRLLSAVMRPSSGTAKVYGYDLISESKQVKSITGLLPEEYALYEKLTIFEYVEFIGKLYNMDDQTIQQRFLEYSSKLQINDLQNRLIETLSKGQKQKVAIITALIQEPQVVFLDEPIANLDVASQKVVKQIILSYKSQNRIILIATHLLENVSTICDDLLLIDEGRILYSGSIETFQKSHLSLEEAYLEYLEGLS